MRVNLIITFLFVTNTIATPRIRSPEIEKEFYAKCSLVAPSDLEFSEKDVEEGHKELTEFLSFARIHEDEFPVNDDSSTTVLSWPGYILMFFPLLIYLLGGLMIVFIVFYFYLPDMFESLFEIFSPNNYDTPYSGTAIEGYNYHKKIRNFLSRHTSVFHLFMFRFACAGVLLVLMAFSLSILVNFEGTADCGIIAAGHKILNGYSNDNSFMELGSREGNSIFDDLIFNLQKMDGNSIDVQKIKDERILEKLESATQSLNVLYDKMSTREVKICSNNSSVFMHPAALESMTKYISRNVQNDLKYMLEFAGNIATVGEVLSKAKNGQRVNTTMYKKETELLKERIDHLASRLQKTHDGILHFFRGYYTLMMIGGIVCVIFFIYSLSLLLPAKGSSWTIPLPIYLIGIVVGLIILSILGSVLFFRSQLLIKNCIVARKFLDDPQEVGKFFGSEDKEWMETCIKKDGIGDIEYFLPSQDRLNLEEFMRLLRAFTSDHIFWTNTTSDEIHEIRKWKHQMNLAKQYKYIEAKDNPQIASMNMLLSQVNSHISCTKNRFELTKDDCGSNYSNILSLQIATEGHVPRCFVPSEMDPKEFQNELLKSCTHHFLDPVILGTFQQLQRCMIEHDSIIDEYFDYFKLADQRLKSLTQSIKRVLPSLTSLTPSSPQLSQVLFSCGSLRGLSRTVLSKSCYSPSYTYGSSLMSLCFISSGFALLVLTLLRFVESMLDRRVVEKWQEEERTATGIFEMVPPL